MKSMSGEPGTYASGTGACAQASAAHKLGLVGNRVQVHMQGGDLLVEFAEDDRVFSDRTCGLYRKYYAGGKFFLLKLENFLVL